MHMCMCIMRMHMRMHMCTCHVHMSHKALHRMSCMQCFRFPGIGPEAESNPVTLRIKYGIIPKKSGIYPNPAAESNLG